jgi:calcium-binding protein CML
MADYNRYGHGPGQGYGGYAPSAPPAPSSSSPYGYGQGGTYPPSAPAPASSSSPYGYGQGQGGYQPSVYPPPMGGFGGGAVAFPPGTHPDVERAFRAVDRDRSGSIDERELQDALSDAYHRFSIRTVRLLMSLFNSNRASSTSPKQMGKLPPRTFASQASSTNQFALLYLHRSKKNVTAPEQTFLSIPVD